MSNSTEPKRKILRRGDRVVDNDGNEGIVVKIIKGFDSSDHGTVTVWQMNRLEYGADNCEHYGEFRWWEGLTIVNEIEQAPENQLETVCRKFINEQDISCAEAIYQVDRIRLSALELLESICEIVGYAG